jgi:hypothetical protein
MTTTLVAAAHEPGPARNSHDGCFARYAEPNLDCPGARTAEWLNDLGADEAPYAGSKTLTNLDVRLNWLRSNTHIVAVEPEVARLRAEKRDLQKRTRYVSRKLRRLERAAR